MAVTGASTIPEQISANILGMKTVAFGVITNPASGLVDNYTHDVEEILLAAKRGQEGLARTMFKMIEQFQFNPEHKVKIAVTVQ